MRIIGCLQSAVVSSSNIRIFKHYWSTTSLFVGHGWVFLWLFRHFRFLWPLMPAFWFTHWFWRRQRRYTAHEWVRMSCHSSIVCIISVAWSSTEARNRQSLLHLLALFDHRAVAIIGGVHQIFAVATHVAHSAVVILYVLLNSSFFISFFGKFLLRSVKASLGLCEWKLICLLLIYWWLTLHAFFSWCFSSFSNRALR